MKRKNTQGSSLQPAVRHAPCLTIGGVFELEGHRYELVAFDGTDCVLRNVEGQGEQMVEQHVLLARLDERRLPDLATLSSEKWDRACQVAAAIRSSIAARATSQSEIAPFAQALRIGTRQFLRYKARYLGSGNLVSACLTRQRGRRAGSRVIPVETDRVISLVLSKLPREAVTLDWIVDRIRERCQKEGIAQPSRDTVARRMRAQGMKLSVRRAVGPEKFSELQQPVPGAHPVDDYLKELQVDHTPMDVMVLDEAREHVLGRPWLTLVLDIATRCILGFYLSLAAPSMVSVARALVMAVLPKRELLRMLNLDHLQWPMYGKPQSILTDHGPEFLSAAFIRGCEQFNIKPRLRPLGAKHWGGHIERAIGTVMGECHLLPGTTFRNSVVRGNYPSEARATLTVTDLTRWTVAGICEHHDTLHRSIDTTPLLQWKKKLGPDGVPSRAIVTEPRELYAAFLPVVSRVVTRRGIQFMNHRYYDPALHAWPYGSSVSFHYDATNTRQILVRSRDGDLINVPRVTRAAYDLLTFEQGLAAAKRAEARAPAVLARKQVARETQHAIVNEAVRAKRSAKKPLNVAIDHFATASPADSRPKAALSEEFAPSAVARQLEGEGQYVRLTDLLSVTELK